MYVCIYVYILYNIVHHDVTILLDSYEVLFMEDLSATLQAEVNVKLDKYLTTPLHQAAKNNLLEAAKMLLDAGADVNPKDSEGETPFDYATDGAKELLAEHGGVEGKS